MLTKFSFEITNKQNKENHQVRSLTVCVFMPVCLCCIQLCIYVFMYCIYSPIITWLWKDFSAVLFLSWIFKHPQRGLKSKQVCERFRKVTHKAWDFFTYSFHGWTTGPEWSHYTHRVATGKQTLSEFCSLAPSTCAEAETRKVSRTKPTVRERLEMYCDVKKKWMIFIIRVVFEVIRQEGWDLAELHWISF